MLTSPFKPKVYDVLQDTSGQYTARLVDEDDVGVSVSDLDTVKLTLYDTTDESIINLRDEQNVKNTNQVTIDVEGNLTWNWLPEDMPMNDTSRPSELHTALFEFVWDSGDSKLLHEVQFRVHKVRIPS